MRRWLIAAIALTTFDAASTFMLLETGDVYEANPLLEYMVVSLGPASAMTIRWAVGVSLLLALERFTKSVEMARAGLRVVTLVLGGLALWHAASWALI